MWLSRYRLFTRDSYALYIALISIAQFDELANFQLPSLDNLEPHNEHY